MTHPLLTLVYQMCHSNYPKYALLIKRNLKKAAVLLSFSLSIEVIVGDELVEYRMKGGV